MVLGLAASAPPIGENGILALSGNITDPVTKELANGEDRPTVAGTYWVPMAGEPDGQDLGRVQIESSKLMPSGTAACAANSLAGTILVAGRWFGRPALLQDPPQVSPGGMNHKHQARTDDA